MRINGYEVSRPMAFGKCGPIWCVSDTQGRDWIAKPLDRALASDGGAIAALQNRMDVLNSLKCPHIVQTKELVRSRGAVFLIMEPIAGADLASLMAANSVSSPEQANSIMLDIAKGLAAMHQAGQCHGDICPDNIMICDNGSAVIVDLYWAFPENGTPGYTAPEVTECGVSQAADIWSWAALGKALGLDESLMEQCFESPQSRPTAAQLCQRLADLPIQSLHPSTLAETDLATFFRGRNLATTRPRKRGRRRATRPRFWSKYWSQFAVSGRASRSESNPRGAMNVKSIKPKSSAQIDQTYAISASELVHTRRKQTDYRPKWRRLAGASEARSNSVRGARGVNRRHGGHNRRVLVASTAIVTFAIVTFAIVIIPAVTWGVLGGASFGLGQLKLLLLGSLM